MSKIRKHHNRGFTLVEVMVFSVVSLMLVGLVAQVFITAAKRTEDSRLRVDVQQSGFLAFKKFEGDINKTSSRAMTAADTPSHYIFAMTPVSPGEHWSPTALIVFKEEQTIYVFDKVKKTLHREIYPPLAPEWAEALSFQRPYIPTATELQEVASTESGQERILCKDVEDFSLQDRNGNKTVFQSQPLRLQMKLRRPLSTSGRSAEFTVERRFALRNSF